MSILSSELPIVADLFEIYNFAILTAMYVNPLKNEAQAALFKGPVRTAQ